MYCRPVKNSGEDLWKDGDGFSDEFIDFGNAKFVKLPNLNSENCDRYEVQFKDNIIPDELKRLVQAKIDNKNHDIYVNDYDDERFLVHLKLYRSDMANIVFNILSDTNNIIYSIEVGISPDEIPDITERVIP